MTIPDEPWLPPAPGEAPDRREQRRGRQLIYGALVFIAAEIVAFGLGAVVAVLAPGPVGEAVGLLVGMTLGAVVAYVGFRRIVARVAGRPGLALSGPGIAREFTVGLALGAVLMVASVALIAVLGGYRVLDIGWSTGIIAGLALGIVPGVIEEVFFRGILLRLIDGWLGSWAALAITMVLFGALHLTNPGATVLGALAITIEAGLLLGAAYLLTRRLWLAMGIHIAWNATQSAIFGSTVSGSGSGRGLIAPELSGPTWLTGGAMGIEGSLVTVAVCGAVGLVVLSAAIRRGRMLGPARRAEDRPAD